ncbi:histidine phosphatase family protein [Roseibium sediminis]|uniref:histidine phosphatase family protein n=1 Tax=Roseibium sediminis TaxID=1775174 RepID=UPI00123D8375|nr:histidine phosphatase family protein [Roseibium sediminis]
MNELDGTLKIVLMRHGKPDIDLEDLLTRRVSAAQVGEIVRAYEMSGLSRDSTPNLSAIEEVKVTGFVICSDLPRAVQSVELLGGRHKSLIDESFRESSLPYLNSRWPRLSLYAYFILFRIAWLLGFSTNGESVCAARRRAARNASKLMELAQTHGSVVLLGHGIMNRLIARELKKSGWRRETRSNEGYWSHTVFEK